VQNKQVYNQKSSETVGIKNLLTFEIKLDQFMKWSAMKRTGLATLKVPHLYVDA